MPAQPSPPGETLPANGPSFDALRSTAPGGKNLDIDTWRDTIVIAALVFALGLLVLLLSS